MIAAANKPKAYTFQLTKGVRFFYAEDVQSHRKFTVREVFILNTNTAQGDIALYGFGTFIKLF